MQGTHFIRSEVSGRMAPLGDALRHPKTMKRGVSGPEGPGLWLHFHGLKAGASTVVPLARDHFVQGTHFSWSEGSGRMLPPGDASRHPKTMKMKPGADASLGDASRRDDLMWCRESSR